MMLAMADSRVYAFPAERKLLGIVNILSIFARHPNVEGNVRAKLLSRPVSHYFDFMQDMARPVLGKRLSTFAKYAECLEKHIMQGTVNVTGEEPAKRTLVYSTLGGQTVRFQGTSSIVKSVAGLDMYLTKVARAGDFVIIDEPEMNTHPDAQMMIAELLAMLVNAGLKVLITTHSPYIADHINNLVEAAKLNKAQRKRVADKLLLKDESAIIERKDVAMYLFGESGRIMPIANVQDDGFDLSTFSTASDRLSGIYADILAITREDDSE